MSAVGDELIRKLRIALAETGYEDAYIEEEGLADDGLPNIFFRYDEVPPEIGYRALSLIGPMPCWTCFCDQRKARTCIVGDCQAGPDAPKMPPRRIPETRLTPTTNEGRV